MRIKAIHAKDIQPIKLFNVHDLSDVVVIAGPNGVGKSRFLLWLLNFIQNLPSSPDNWIQVEATSPTEKEGWGKSILDTRDPKIHRSLKPHYRKNDIVMAKRAVC